MTSADVIFQVHFFLALLGLRDQMSIGYHNVNQRNYYKQPNLGFGGGLSNESQP